MGDAIVDDCVLLLAAAGTGGAGVGVVGVDGWRHAGTSIARMTNDENVMALARRAVCMR